MAGRPSTYDPLAEAEIFARLAAGETLKAICGDEHLPPDPTVRRWIVNDTPPGISARYAHARSLGLDAMAEDAVRIADDAAEDPNSRRVRVDTRKWLLSKLRPDRYGDRLELAGDGLDLGQLGHGQGEV